MKAAAIGSSIGKLIKQSEVRETTQTSDTLRIWESHREQAILWRAIALIQVPVTLIALVLCITLWLTHSTVLNVPAKPLPGTYLAQTLPDTEFIEYATEYVNLIATYTPDVVERQYRKATEMLWGSFLDQFKSEMLSTEVRAVTDTQRTQLFFIDPSATKIQRISKSEVMVSFTGDRTKIVAGSELPMVPTSYEVVMTTIPRHSLNPYGIVIINSVSKNTIEELKKERRRR